MTAKSTPLKLELAQLSDLGMRRANNQDSLTSVVTDEPGTWAERGHLMMVADGMGAHAAGELASKLAIDNLPHAYYKSTESSPAIALRQAVHRTNEIINTKGEDSVDFRGMGTTCTCLVLIPQGALIAHVGDSRAYRLRGTSFQQLTFDHSLVWEAAAAGQSSAEGVLNALPRNVITRSLGPHKTVNVDLEGPFDVVEGDVFLICSDGLTGEVTDLEIGTILGSLSAQDAAQTLVDFSNLRGGSDNISVAIARVQRELAGPESSISNTLRTSSASLRGRIGLRLRSILLACLAFFFVFLAIGWPWATVACAVGLAASVVVAAVRWLVPPRTTKPTINLKGPYGNGPYRDYDCQPSQLVVDALEEIAKQLHKLAQQDSRLAEKKWQEIEAHQKLATEAAKAENFSVAVAEYCHTIRHAMQQLRGKSATMTAQSVTNFDKNP
jgi:serine/threonine protein phosphatase PrpC